MFSRFNTFASLHFIAQSKFTNLPSLIRASLAITSVPNISQSDLLKDVSKFNMSSKYTLLQVAI